ncbi:hypothetical protein M406DRAFT_357001 [Cryphonectria parasitica EP155]|uniref:CFEM domain-containing protein n=1 Tax=Cryphonectria parasitica (strain ATCC 38755 / EP155) TaxID=660469 RepID=A0A9P5CLP2_CRYP1|nr:uncharacterized protein M406DRAFT_357001 [Cryphonectria parasitica EP155]KAF3763293.1 hypothetical protein M406DRAFT_357001 [Cryphonectria parasitica EP155]
MKLPSSLLSTSLVAVLFHDHFALAQNCVATALSVIPSCAQNCILNGATSVGCGGTDFDCQCQKTAALFAAVDGCVASACPSASFQAVIDGASTVCDCASPAVLAGAAGTVSVSGSFIPGTVPASNSATVTGASATATPTPTTLTSASSTSGTVLTSGSGTTATTGSSAGQGSSPTWTGYSSVGTVVTASVVGGAARPTAPAALDVVRYVVPVMIAGAAVL